jgi:hypothetical protein
LTETKCRICDKALSAETSIRYLEGVCSNCWDNLLCGVQKQKRANWEQLLYELALARKTSEDLTIERRDLKQKLEQFATNQTSLTAFCNFIIKYLAPILYHITAIENIPTIMEKGILCRNSMLIQKANNVSYSNSEIVENRSTISIGNKTASDFVPLFFAEKPPMLSAIEHHQHSTIVYICIKGKIIKEEGVHFSDGNIACRGRTNIYANINSLVELDWANIRTFNETNCGFEEAKRVKSAEVLVPLRIDPDWFMGFIVPNEDAKNTLYNYGIELPIEVNPDLYFMEKI